MARERSTAIERASRSFKDRFGSDRTSVSEGRKFEEKRDRERIKPSSTSTAIKQKEKELVETQLAQKVAEERRVREQNQDRRSDEVQQFQDQAQQGKGGLSQEELDLQQAQSDTEVARLSTEDKRKKERDAIRKRFQRKGSLNLLSLAEEQRLG